TSAGSRASSLPSGGRRSGPRSGRSSPPVLPGRTASSGWASAPSCRRRRRAGTRAELLGRELEPPLARPGRGLGAALEPELAQELAHVVAHGLLGEVKHLADGPVR